MLQNSCRIASLFLFIHIIFGAVCESFAQNASAYLPPAQESYNRTRENVLYRPALRSRPSSDSPTTIQQPAATTGFNGDVPQLQLNIYPQAPQQRRRIRPQETPPLAQSDAATIRSAAAPVPPFVQPTRRADIVSPFQQPKRDIPSMIRVKKSPASTQPTPDASEGVAEASPWPTGFMEAPLPPAPTMPPYEEVAVTPAIQQAQTLPSYWYMQSAQSNTENVAVTPPDRMQEVSVQQAPIAPHPVIEHPTIEVPVVPEPASVQEDVKVTIFDPLKDTAISPLDASMNAVTTAPLPEEQPKNLSGETESILRALPHDLFPETQVRKEKSGFGVNRSQEGVIIPKVKTLKAETGIGANVAVRRQSIDVNYELEKAYNALLQGSTEAAIAGYKDVLAQDTDNKNAMFGLATTYHKLGMLEQARQLYGRLLDLDPYNAEVLNNFLAMVGEEAPESAILYLEQLKAQNSEFSPIYGQLAQLYAKQNDLPNAIMNMQQAVALSPENMVYKYNLAVLYDTYKDYRRAEVLYRQVLRAGMDGQDIPASAKDIQERLIYLGSK